MSARHHALGDLRARRDADAPARGAREARAEGRPARAALGAQPASTARRRFAGWAERIWRRPLLYGIPALVLLVVLALPIFSLDTGMPSIKVVPTSASSRQGYDWVQQAFGPGAPGALQVVGPAGGASQTTSAALAEDPGHRAGDAAATRRRARLYLVQAIPRDDPSERRSRQTIDRAPITTLPADVLVGGAAAENHDLESALGARTVLVIGVVLVLGFLLLLLALQAPVIAAVGRGSRTCWRPAPPSASRSSSSRTATAPACSASSRRASSTRGARSSSSR